MKINHHNAVAFVAHCNNLCLLAGIEPNFYEGYKLYEKLRRLELKASRFSEAMCNGTVEDTDEVIKFDSSIQAKVLKLLPRLDSTSFFLNGDPRGYALKLNTTNNLHGEKDRPAVLGNPDKHRDKPETVPDFIKENNFHRDMGGYGILAPEF